MRMCGMLYGMLIMLALLLLAPQEPPLPSREAIQSARDIDFHISRVSARHNKQFVDAWQKYLDAFSLWWRLTQQNAAGITVQGEGMYSLELGQATGQLKAAAKELLKETERIVERIEELEKSTRKAPPK